MVLNNAISTFKGKYVTFSEKVDVLEKVIKVSLLPDPDRDRAMNSTAITRCAKCKTGFLEVKMSAKGVVLGCGKCDKEVVLVTDADKLQRVNQRCYKCDKYMVNVIKGSQSKGIQCAMCDILTAKKVADKEKADKKQQRKESKAESVQSQEEIKEGGKKPVEEAKKKSAEEEKKGKKKKHKKKKAIDIPVIVNPSSADSK